MNILVKYNWVLTKEVNSELVYTTLEVICIILEDIGPAFIQNNIDDFVKSLEILFKHEAVC